MAKNSILGQSPMILCLFILCLLGHFYSYESVEEGGVGPSNAFTISSFTYAPSVLKHYEWRYIRVDLPPWFSSMSIALDSDVGIDIKDYQKVPKGTLPIICFREGSPPLPDVYNTSLTGLVLEPLSNGSFEGIQNLQIAERCYPMQKNIRVKLTNEQISPGVWYFGIFNGIGPVRVQSKMINRGSEYSFSGNVIVEGCATLMLAGPYCNQTVEQLSCVDSYNLTGAVESYNQTTASIISCKNADGNFCHADGELKVYSLDILGIAERLMITVTNVNVTQSSDNYSNSNDIGLTCYARQGAMPLETSHDYSGDIKKAPLIISSPKVGRWYFMIKPNKDVAIKQKSIEVCYSLELQIRKCPVERAGFNCTWERYMLQTVLRKNPSVPFESYYLPASGKLTSKEATFFLEPLVSNSSDGGKTGVAWTYFLMDIPSAAAGGNIHIRLTSDEKVNYEVFAKYGGLPSNDSWDYFYANTTSNSNGSMFFKLYDASEQTVSFYILYVKGGTWSIGLKSLNLGGTPFRYQTAMSISLERCPRRCSSHGRCESVLDASGLTLYSYCICDRDHGGFDCSVEIVSHRGHIWQSIALIASNVAAVLPAYWSLRQKAFAEWVLFTSSGISSGLYHACDVGTWCVLTFRVLQFMDFWLSFMAVVSTFIFLADIDEVSKRTIHTVVAIITAMLAVSGPTRPTNIAIVFAIGTVGLIFGWLMEFFSKIRSLSFSTGFFFNMLERWYNIKRWFKNIIETLLKRFRWGFVLAGLTMFALAVTCWIVENTETYWIWHSVWHVSIYTSSFLFLCSKAKIVEGENEGLALGTYELTRQDSFSRAD